VMMPGLEHVEHDYIVVGAGSAGSVITRRRNSNRRQAGSGDSDPAQATVEHTDDLRGTAIAADAARADEAYLQEAVQLARAHGRSWNQIAVASGASRQAARQRFAAKYHA